MANLLQSLNSLKANIFGGGGAGSTTSVIRQTPIELANKSPTSRLDKDPMDFSTLSYPLDVINDTTNGHYMLFYINVQNKTRFPYTRALDGVQIGEKQITTVEQTTETGAVPQLGYKNKVTKSYEEVTTGGAIQNAEAFFSGNLPDTNYSDVQTLRQDKTKMKTNLSSTDIMKNATVRIKESVAIYLPPNVQDSYTTKYSGAETAILGFMAASGGKFLDAYRKNDFTTAGELLKDTAGGFFTEMGKRAGAAALDLLTSSEGALELGAKIFGATTNPYMEVLFGGVDLRTFTYNFTFAPRSKAERDEVQKIIHTFRFYQAPELRSNQSMYMGLPAEFDIHYMYQPDDGSEARENPYYNKIATCVLQNVTVDYTPEGVKSHADGSPVLIKMSLQFMETEMITKDHIEAGY